MTSIENTWQIKQLGDKEYFTLIMGQSPDGKTYNDKKIGLPFFQGKKEFGEKHPIVKKRCSEPGKIAEPGDILLSVRAPVGPTNIANIQCCIGRGLAAIRPNPNKCSIDYLMYFFKRFQANIAYLGKGSTFDAITKVDLENIQIPLPPLAIQQQIVSHLDGVHAEIQTLRTMYESQLKHFADLKASILDEVFSGNWKG